MYSWSKLPSYLGTKAKNDKNCTMYTLNHRPSFGVGTRPLSPLQRRDVPGMGHVLISG